MAARERKQEKESMKEQINNSISKNERERKKTERGRKQQQQNELHDMKDLEIDWH